MTSARPTQIEPIQTEANLRWAGSPSPPPGMATTPRPPSSCRPRSAPRYPLRRPARPRTAQHSTARRSLESNPRSLSWISLLLAWLADLSPPPAPARSPSSSSSSSSSSEPPSLSPLSAHLLRRLRIRASHNLTSAQPLGPRLRLPRHLRRHARARLRPA